MNERLAAWLHPVSNWWQGLSARERGLVSLLSLVLVFAVVYWGVIAPMQSGREQALTKLQREKSLHSWVANKADEIVTLRAQKGQSRVVSQPLNQVVSSSVKRFGVDLQRVQPRDESLQVVIAPLPFNTLVEWLDFLSGNYGVEVEFIDIASTDTSGVVEIKRLQLRK